MLRIEQICCARGPRELFRGLSFAARRGEWIRLTGPNGSGKTTLLRALAGLTRPICGTIAWDDTFELEAIRTYVGHAAGWKDMMSVTENLRIGWELDAEPAAREAGAATLALQRAGLAAQRNLAVARLSQGQKKRLHLARLSRSSRPVWLLDEPGAALDADGTAFLAALVGDHLRKGGVAVIATHQALSIDGAGSHDVTLSG